MLCKFQTQAQSAALQHILFTEIDQILDGLYLISRTLKHFQSFSFPLEGIT